VFTARYGLLIYTLFRPLNILINRKIWLLATVKWRQLTHAQHF